MITMSDQLSVNQAIGKQPFHPFTISTATEWNEVVNQYKRLIFGIAYRTLISRTDAENVTQEVFLALHKRIQSGEPIQNIEAWLRVVTHNKTVDALRSKTQTVDVDSETVESMPADDLTEKIDQALVLWGLVNDLPKPQRIIITAMLSNDPATDDEIARRAGVNAKSVSQYRGRAIKTLRERVNI